MAQIDIIGILDDGSTPSPALPQNTVKTVNLSQYEDLTINLTVFYPSGIPTLLADIGAALIFTVNKNSINGIPPFISRPGVLAPLVGPNKATFSVLPANTAPTAPGYVGTGRYVCDIWLIAGGKNNHIWGLSQFSLNPSVWTPGQSNT